MEVSSHQVKRFMNLESTCRDENASIHLYARNVVYTKFFALFVYL